MDGVTELQLVLYAVDLSALSDEQEDTPHAIMRRASAKSDCHLPACWEFLSGSSTH
jgi:hypothetical protein